MAEKRKCRHCGTTFQNWDEDLGLTAMDVHERECELEARIEQLEDLLEARGIPIPADEDDDDDGDRDGDDDDEGVAEDEDNDGGVCRRCS